MKNQQELIQGPNNNNNNNNYSKNFLIIYVS